MTMQEFATLMNRAAEIYKGKIIGLNNDLDGNLHILLKQEDFDKVNINVTAAYPCTHSECRGDWEIEKQVGNIVFTVYHRGAYNRQEVA